jgi:hypothetical protein
LSYVKTPGSSSTLSTGTQPAPLSSTALQISLVGCDARGACFGDRTGGSNKFTRYSRNCSPRAASSVFSSRTESIMHLIILRLDHMTSGNQCQVKDDLVNQLIALNNKLNTLSPALLHSEQAREEVQQQRENLYVEIKRHRAKGHRGKPCPAVQRFPFR